MLFLEKEGILLDPYLETDTPINNTYDLCLETDTPINNI
jgi:hypothetical protein